MTEHSTPGQASHLSPCKVQIVFAGWERVGSDDGSVSHPRSEPSPVLPLGVITAHQHTT